MNNDKNPLVDNRSNAVTDKLFKDFDIENQGRKSKVFR